MSNTTNNPVPESVSPVKVPIALSELHEEVELILAKATVADRKTAKDITEGKFDRKDITLTSTVAALLFTEHNEANRALSVPRARGYAAAMVRGEWLANHQGIAFVKSGQLADGQHRVCAVALSGMGIDVMVYNDFNPDAIDTIDRSTRRTAGESLEMNGVVSGKVKARVAKAVMSYEAEVHGQPLQFTDIQIEAWVMTNEAFLNAALDMGDTAALNVSDPCLKSNDSYIIGALLLHGGWPPMIAAGFISSLLTGMAAFPESATVYLARIFLKATFADRKKDKLPAKARYALSMKGINLWANEISVANVKWNSSRETLPSNEYITPTGK